MTRKLTRQLKIVYIYFQNGNAQVTTEATFFHNTLQALILISTLQHLEELISIFHVILPLLSTYAVILIGEKKQLGCSLLPLNIDIYTGAIYSNCHSVGRFPSKINKVEVISQEN